MSDKLYDKQVLNMREAAELLGISRQTLGEWLKTRDDIPHQKRGSRGYIFSRKALEGWVAGKTFDKEVQVREKSGSLVELLERALEIARSLESK